MKEVKRVGANEFLKRVAEHLEDGRALVDHEPVGIEDRDDVQGMLHKAAKRCFAPASLRAGTVRLGRRDHCSLRAVRITGPGARALRIVVASGSDSCARQLNTFESSYIIICPVMSPETLRNRRLAPGP